MDLSGAPGSDVSHVSAVRMCSREHLGFLKEPCPGSVPPSPSTVPGTHLLYGRRFGKACWVRYMSRQVHDRSRRGAPGPCARDNQKSITFGDVLGDSRPSLRCGEWVLQHVPSATGEAALEKPRPVTRSALGR